MNKTGAAVAIGDVLNFIVNTSDANGANVHTPVTADLSAFAGVAVEVAGTAKAVKCQTGGYCAQVQVISSTSLVGGNKMIPVNTKPYLAFGAAADGYPAFAVLASTGTVTAASTVLLPCILYGLT
jgi:hypothetical protein